jgi:hypothetical protein
MSYEEMYETPLVEHAALHRDLVEESLAQRSTEVEGSQAPSTTNGTPNQNPDSVDSAPAVVERGRNRSSVPRQRSIDESMDQGRRQDLDRLWASFFYEANIAFNVVRHPAFIKAVTETAAAGFNYKPPSYNALRTKMIGEKKIAVDKVVSNRTSASIDIYGATICSDGWFDTNSRP